MMEDAEFMPLVRFPDQSPSFVLGFEAGMVWSRMQQGEAIIENAIPYHVENLEVFQRMADAGGDIVDARRLEQIEWAEITFRKRPPARGSHLRVVQ